MRIVFRTEANHTQGLGDLFGSLALAEECTRQGDDICFVVSAGEEAERILLQRDCPFHAVGSSDDEETFLRRFRPDVILVNKLKNSPAYIKALKNLAGLVVTVDDAGEGARHAALNINALYPIPGSVTGAQYLALREEFQELHGRLKTIHEDVRTLLITQGGSDTYGFTPRIVRALSGLASRPHCTVVIGPAFRHHSELEEALASSSLEVSVVQDPKNMTELMVSADLAITAGGLTMFELACVGTPSVVICGEPFEVETAQRLE